MWEIFTKNGCPICTFAIEMLAAYGEPYEVKKVDTSPELLTELKTRVVGAKSVPQIFRDGVYIGTYKDLKQWLENAK